MGKSYKRYSKYDVQLLILPGKYWKWCVVGGAVELANQFLKSNFQATIPVKNFVTVYDWSTFASHYDETFLELISD